MIRPHTLITALAIAALLSGCSTAPAYHRPAMAPLPKGFKEEASGWSAASPSDAVAKGAWWKLFGDPVLTGLVEKVEVTNQTVAQYRAAYAAARAVTREQRAALFPTVTAQVDASDAGSKTTGGSGLNSSGSTGQRYTAQIGATWEPDLWGQLGNGVSQARASEQASAGDLANATLSARGELASDYLQLRGIDAERLLLDQTVTAYDRTLTITQNKYKAGTVAHSDVDQAQTALSNAQADRRDLDRQRAAFEHAIAVLAGENPSSFTITPVAWNPVVPDVPGTIPSAVLQRRPDIAAAERRVAAANSSIGIQRSAFFPQVSLSAGAGLSATGIGDLFVAPVTLWSLGVSAVETLLDFGANKAKLAQAHAEYDQAAAIYRETALTAFQQVEDDLASVSAYTDEARFRDEASSSADRAEQIARNQYLAGTIDYSSVVTAQTAAYSARQARVQVVVNRQTTAVALVQAIGGHWDPAASTGS